MLNIVLSALFLIVAILLTLTTHTIPGGGKWDILGPRFFPKLILICGAIFSLIILAGSVQAYRRERAERAGTETAFWKSYREIIVIFLAMFLFLLAFEPLGFVLTVLAFLVLLQWYLGTHRFQISTILVPLIAVVLIYFVFTKYLHVLFPAGPLETLLNLD